MSLLEAKTPKSPYRTPTNSEKHIRQSSFVTRYSSHHQLLSLGSRRRRWTAQADYWLLRWRFGGSGSFDWHVSRVGRVDAGFYGNCTEKNWRRFTIKVLKHFWWICQISAQWLRLWSMCRAASVKENGHTFLIDWETGQKRVFLRSTW